MACDDLDDVRVSDYLTNVVRFNRLIEGAITEGTDLTFTAWRMLQCLELCRDRGVRMGDMARYLALNASTASDCATHLEERGYAVRRPDPNDLKAVWVDLTHEGAAALVDANEALLRGSAVYWNDARMAIREILMVTARECLASAGFDAARVAELDGSVCFSFSSSYHLRSNANWIKSSYGMGFLDARILVRLFEEKAPLRMSDIAELLEVQPSSCTASIRYISSVRGYVRRTKNPANRREIVVALTPEGERAAEEIRSRFLDRNSSFIGRMVEMMRLAPPVRIRGIKERIADIRSRGTEEETFGAPAGEGEHDV